MDIVEELSKVALLGSAWVLYLLLLMSVASIGVIIERTWYFWRIGRGGGEELRLSLLRALQDDDLTAAQKILRDSGTIEGRAVAGALQFREGGGRAVSDALEAELALSRKELERGTVFLGTVGNNAPFVGLFGTVIGVIIAFHELGTAAARAGAMGNVMSGIAEALVATGVGIFVALPAVVAYNVAQKRIGDIEQQAVNLGRIVSAWLETKEKGGVLHLAPASEPARRAHPDTDATPSASLAVAGSGE